MSIAEANSLSVVIFIMSLYILIHLKHRAVNIILVVVAAIVGQIFFGPNKEDDANDVIRSTAGMVMTNITGMRH